MPFVSGAVGAPHDVGRRAWKFLAPGAVAPFAGTRWPTPSAAGPGAWVVGETEAIYACRTRDLSWWLDSELWEIELAGPLEELPTQLRGRAGRLLARVTLWDEAALHAYGEACAWRARQWAVEALVSEGLHDDADALRGCLTLEERHRPGKGRRGTEPCSEPGRFLGGYGSPRRTRQGGPGSLQCSQRGHSVRRFPRGLRGRAPLAGCMDCRAGAAAGRPGLSCPGWVRPWPPEG